PAQLLPRPALDVDRDRLLFRAVVRFVRDGVFAFRNPRLVPQADVLAVHAHAGPRLELGMKDTEVELLFGVLLWGHVDAKITNDMVLLVLQAHDVFSSGHCKFLEWRGAPGLAPVDEHLARPARLDGDGAEDAVSPELGAHRVGDLSVGPNAQIVGQKLPLL